ncbi:MAG TPA: DUF4249 domain-containing protein [Chitinophagales bacterium]|nr:DUF4249 domain-containing protein [Chitinophagales bacterium]
MQNKFLPIAFVLLTVLAGCEKDVFFDVPDAEPKIVVEGRIEAGQPPFVILTRTSNYYGTTNINDLGNLVINGAVVRVSDGTDTVTLTNITFDSLGIELGFYTDPLFFTNPSLAFVGQPERSYTLWVEAGGQSVSAVTTIPTSYPLDSIWVMTDVKDDRPDLVRLMIRYTDPPSPGQYVRYFTQRDGEAFKPGLTSVFEDALVNGTTFDFSLDRGYDQTDSIDFEEYGLFERGDTITVKWCNIDKAHFDFWRTMEYEINQGGPYASPVKIESNVVGGLGIWGGYNCSFKTVVVPE